MKKILSLLLIILFSPPLFAQSEDSKNNRSLVFTNVTVIDMLDSKPKAEMTVVITNDRITAIGKSSKIRLPKNVRVIDASGKFLIPGLWDMHVHALRLERVETFFPLFIANGVTGIRDMGTTAQGFAQIARLRQEIAAETRIGPRIIAAGRILDGAKPAVPENSIVFTNETEARQAVRDLKAAGADFIKIYDGVPRAQYFAIIDEAKKLKIPFAGHVPTEVTALEASDAGQKSFEHLGNILRSCSSRAPAEIDAYINQTIKPGEKPNDFSAIPARIAARTKIELESYDAQRCSLLFTRFVKNRTWQVPTLITKKTNALIDSIMTVSDTRTKYVSPAARERWKPENNPFLKFRTAEFIEMRKRLYQKELELVREMHRAGVPLMTGTDIPAPFMYPGFSLHDELELFVEAGFTPFEALRAATRNPAEFLGLQKQLGTIEKGKLADLVLLDANPLADIRNTKRIAAVVSNGRYFSKEAREKILAEVEASVGKQ